MDNDKVTQEELQAEQAELKEVKEEEVRASIINEYGFDETVDSERIDKLTAKEIEHRKKISQAIGQKIKWRNKANEPKPLESKPNNPKPEEVKSDDLTIKDSILIQRANVDVEDIDEVVKWAKFNKQTIGEALQDDILKAVLAKKSEIRKTSQATSTGPTKRVVTKKSDEEIIQDSQSGKIPKPGSEEAERLFWARRGGKR